MKHLDVYDFPNMQNASATTMRKNLINYFNTNRDNKDGMLELQGMLRVMTAKINECLLEHETDPRDASGNRMAKRAERDQAAAAPVINVPTLEPVQVAPQQQGTLVGMQTTGQAALVIPELTNV